MGWVRIWTPPRKARYRVWEHVTPRQKWLRMRSQKRYQIRQKKRREPDYSRGWVFPMEIGRFKGVRFVTSSAIDNVQLSDPPRIVVADVYRSRA